MELNIGIAGIGNFARFAGKVFAAIPGIKIIAVADIDQEAVTQMTAEWNATGYLNYDDLLNDSRITLIYIATPPWLHYEHSKNALLKGKHVICEKPAALKTSEAAELATLSTSLDLLWVVNLMQRYNPLYSVVKKIVEEKRLGSFLHGFFENYASDQYLEPTHWFWDKTKSGGIFIEHGVHFFDMFDGWLGKGKLLNAVELTREIQKRKISDRVQATVLYDHGLVNFYHGFDQPKILDRQEMRLQFEAGELTLYEWVPVKMKLHGLLKDKDIDRLNELSNNFTLTDRRHFFQSKTRGRFQEISYDNHITMEYKDSMEKDERYQLLLKDMITDQWRWIQDRTHRRIIDQHNAVNSLTMAEAAMMALQKNNL